jgi:hypothetical protein
MINAKRVIVAMLFIFYCIGNVNAEEVGSSEVIDIGTDVSIRVHPKTGEEYICLRAAGEEAPAYRFQIMGERYSRPDYEMLSHNVRSGDIPYDGPVSDRTKIYVLAATLAASGIAAGVVAQAAAAGAAATTAASASTAGAGAYATAGAVLAGVSVATPLIKAQPDPNRDDFIHESRVTVLQ